ncbi:MAG: methylmalonyl-CoA epimerase [Bacteroidota bacterium]
MWKNVEHIGIAVQDIVDSDELFQRLFGKPPYKKEQVASENVTTSFFQLGETKIELLQGEEDSAIAKFLDKRGPGIHHIAFEVEDIFEEMARLKKEGFRVLSDEPKVGADNKLVCFVHPKSANGVLIELCQEIIK